MTSAIIKILFSDTDDTEYFSIFVGSDGDPKSIKKLWDDFSDNTYLNSYNKGRLNWTYMATNFVRYIQTTVYDTKSVYDCNRVFIVTEKCRPDVIYEYSLKPIANLYADSTIGFDKSVEFKVIKCCDDEDE